MCGSLKNYQKDKVQKEKVEYLGASDIVNGTPALYDIKEPEMESALNEVMKELYER